MSWSLFFLDLRKFGGKTTDKLNDVIWETKHSPPQGESEAGGDPTKSARHVMDVCRPTNSYHW